jgi:hypothetical protein
MVKKLASEVARYEVELQVTLRGQFFKGILVPTEKINA